MPSPLKILISGSKGQLGNELKVLSEKYTQYRFLFFDKDEWPVDDAKITQTIFEKYQPHFVINCAAYTNVDKAESEKERAFKINSEAVGSLAKFCSQFNVKLIHISTDYVFDGSASQPLKETDLPNPVNSYGESKLKGEQLVLQNNPDAIIIRTSWVYSSFEKNFVKTMIRLMHEKESINVVTDQFGSPTYAADLAEACIDIIANSNWQPGIYNFSNEGVISWFDFAKEISSHVNYAGSINPVSTNQFPSQAKRPKYGVFDKSKIQQVYNIQLKPWKISLQECIQKIKNEDITF